MFRLLILTTFACTLKQASYNCSSLMALKSMDFEVFGRVQGVFFRKFTQKQAVSLGLRGWCKNTDEGTVLGHMQGPNDKVEAMMEWLKTTGSPSSKIEKAEFRNQKEISEFTYDDFKIVGDD